MLERTENRGLAGVDSLCTSPELSLGAALRPVMQILGPSLLLGVNTPSPGFVAEPPVRLSSYAFP